MKKILGLVSAAISTALLCGMVGQPASSLVPAADSPNGSPVDFGTTLYVGPGETMRTAYLRQKAKYGGIEVARLFFQGFPPSWQTLNSTVEDTELILSFRLAPARVLAGEYDTRLRQWFAAAPTNRTTRWTYMHEPEDDIERGSLNASQYRAAWRHVVEIEHQVGNPQLQATLILMCWTFNPKSNRNWQTYWAGDDVVDAVGFDCYNAAYRQGRYGSEEKQLGNPTAWALGKGIPWGVAEFGSHKLSWDDGTGRADWITRMVNYSLSRNAQFMSYFDTKLKADYRLLDEPSRSTYAHIIQNR